MSPETRQKLEQVQRYSTSLKVLFNVATLILAIAGLAGLVVVLTREPGTIEFGRATYSGDEITWSVRIASAIGMALSIGITLKLLHHFGRLFGHYAKGEIFTSDSVRHIREIGVSVFLFVSVWIYGLLANYVLGIPAAGAAARAAAGAGSFDFGLPAPLGVVLAGIIIVVISWIMDVGRELREEQDLTV